MIRDVKAVNAEPCIRQHRLLICVLDLKERIGECKVKFVKMCKVWKLKQAETEGIFRERVHAKVVLVREKPGGHHHHLFLNCPSVPCQARVRRLPHE